MRLDLVEDVIHPRLGLGVNPVTGVTHPEVGDEALGVRVEEVPLV